MTRTMSEVVVPQRWPSAWPDLRRRVAERCTFPVTAAVLTLVGLAWLGELSLTWWVPLLPLLLVISPLSWPGRVRRRFESAAGHGTLVVREVGPDLVLRPRRSRIAARASADGSVRYLPC